MKFGVNIRISILELTALRSVTNQQLDISPSTVCNAIVISASTPPHALPLHMFSFIYMIIRPAFSSGALNAFRQCRCWEQLDANFNAD
jgi:hypothetical protein